MKIFTVGLIIISAVIMSSIILTPSITLLASSKGLKVYLTVDTNLNDGVQINTYQYDDKVFTHHAFVHSGTNEVDLQYPKGLIDTGEFRVCVKADQYDRSNCEYSYNSVEKKPESLTIPLFVKDVSDSPNTDSQAQSQSQSNDNTNTNTNANSQSQTTIMCPENRDCVIQR